MTGKQSRRRKRCHYCKSAPGTTKDHIVPKHRGGPNDQRNYVWACQPCNNAKGNKMPTCGCEKCRTAVALFGRYRFPGGTSMTYTIGGGWTYD